VVTRRTHPATHSSIAPANDFIRQR
jgi:hypothetical protein